MEHQATTSQVSIRENETVLFYQGIKNTTQEGVVFIDEGSKGYLQVHYRKNNERLEMTLISKYSTLFSDRVKSMIFYEQPKQVSKLDFIDFIKAYKTSLYVF